MVYAGTSPDGKVYRIENGKATEYFAPKARYIWSLAVGARWRALRRHRRSGQGLSRDSAGQGRSSITRPANRTSPASPSIRKAACWRAPSPTAFCTASPPRTKRSFSTTRICRRFAPSCPCPMARSTRRRSAAPSPSARRAASRRPRRAPAALPVTAHHHHHGGGAGAVGRRDQAARCQAAAAASCRPLRRR